MFAGAREDAARHYDTAAAAWRSGDYATAHAHFVAAWNFEPAFATEIMAARSAARMPGAIRDARNWLARATARSGLTDAERAQVESTRAEIEQAEGPSYAGLVGGVGVVLLGAWFFWGK
jgi:hypothetical protein